MKKSITVFTCLFMTLFTFGQIKFEKGYYINNKNEKKVGWIKNIGWKNNPDKIEYKNDKNSSAKVLYTQDIKAFGVGQFKYVRFDVKIDRSSPLLSKLNTVKTPEYHDETLLLKELVEGYYSLFSYTDSNLKVFFKLENQLDIEQLFYKKYKITEYKIGENNSFKTQLISFSQCSTISHQKLNNLSYSQNELVKLFIKANQCKDRNYSYVAKKSKSKFYLTARPGLILNSLAYKTTPNSTSPAKTTIDFGTKPSFRVGLEAEVIFGFNKNKWSFIFEPSYNGYSARTTEKTNSFYEGELTYSILELALGIRHYFFLNDTSKIFVNFNFIPIVDLGSKLDFDDPYRNSFEFSSTRDFSLGLGYNYRQKLSFEYRYYLGRKETMPNLLTRHESDAQYMSFILGYTLF